MRGPRLSPNITLRTRSRRNTAAAPHLQATGYDSHMRVTFTHQTDNMTVVNKNIVLLKYGAGVLVHADQQNLCIRLTWFKDVQSDAKNEIFSKQQPVRQIVIGVTIR